jgi:DNA repair protein RadC
MYVRELVVSYRRRQLPMASGSHVILAPRDAAAVFASIIGEEAVEVVGVLCLTTKHRLIAYHEIKPGDH